MKNILEFIAMGVVIATVGALIGYLGYQVLAQHALTATVWPAVTFAAGDYGSKDFPGGLCAEATYTANGVTVMILPCETEGVD